MVGLARYAVFAIFVGMGAFSAHAQAVWDIRGPLTQTNSLNAVVWAGNPVNQYVAVGASGTIVMSPDGITWTARSSGVQGTLYSVAWTGNKLVAVGASGVILTSDDGSSWSSVSSGTGNALFSVTWSGAKLVAVGQSGTVLNSTTGATWNTVDVSALTTQTLYAVTWSTALARFVVVGNSSAGLESSNGDDWSVKNTGGGALYSVTWTGGEFIAVGANGVIRAYDGTAWTSRASGGQLLLGVVLGSRLVTVGGAGTIRHSPDGATWTTVSSGTTQSINAVAWSGTGFIAVGGSGTVLASTDGITWAQTSSVITGLNAVTSRIITTPAPDTQIVAVGDAGIVITSSNGIDWVKRTSNTTAALYGVTWTGTLFAAVGANGALITSPDGVTWTASSALSSYKSGANSITRWSVAGNGSALVAVGAGGEIAYSSNGGALWADPLTPNAEQTLYGVTHVSGSTYIAVGEMGVIRRTTSPAGTWAIINSPTTNRLMAVSTHNGTQLVAVGVSGTILTSTTGTGTGTGTWTPQVSGALVTLRGVTWTGSQIVAVGDGGTILTSSNSGGTWNPQVSGVGGGLNGTRWDGRLVTAVGAGGRIVTSHPGAVPLTPSTSSPADLATKVPVNPAFSWTSSSGAVSYGLQISTSPTFVDTLIDTTAAGTMLTLGPLATGTLHYWRVRANGGTGSSAWSPISAFTVIQSDSSAPVPASPAQNATNIPLSTTLSWNAYAGAQSYRIQFSIDSTFATAIVNDSDLIGLTRGIGGLSYLTTYYWRISAKLASGVAAWSSVRKFTTTSPPPVAPTLSSPAINEFGVPLNGATFSWNASSGAVEYRLQISTDVAFSTLVRDTTVTGAVSATINGLSLNASYYWRVSASNAAGSSANSAARTFTTSTAPPSAPSLVSPANNATDVSVYASLTWNATSNALTYHVQLSTSQTFASLVFEDSTLTTTTRSPGQLANTTQYWWRVRAKNPAGVSAWTTRTFTSDTAPTSPPQAPGLLTPTQFSTINTLAPTLTWSAAATATSYSVQVSLAPDFAALLVNDTGITATSKALSGLSGSTSYYWRVSATNQIGTGVWSETFLFTTPAVTPTAPTLVSPEQFSTGVSVFPTLVWNASAGASSYRVQVSTAVSFAVLLVNDSVTTTSRALTGLSGNTEYYWRVSARNSAGVSAYSTIYRFATGAIPIPETPTLVSPAQFDTGVAIPATLTWLASTGASAYVVQVSPLSDFSTLVLNDSTVAGTTRSVSGLQKGASYFWRVAARNSAGTSAFSGTRRFTTESEVAILPKTLVFRTLSSGNGRVLRFGLPRSERVSVRVFDTRGNQVAVLLDGPRSAGYHSVTLPQELRGGIYLVDFRAGAYRATVKTQP